MPERIALLLAVLLFPLLVRGEVRISQGIDPLAGLPFWEVADAGVSIRLVQRLPDQTRAFFLARGFSPEDAERVAQSCVFQTVVRNVSNQSKPGPVRYDLGMWRVRNGDRMSRMKTREDWAGEWRDRNLATASRVAFQWALYPTEQTYQPGDYNWGMSTFALPPGTYFDLDLSWFQYGVRHEARIAQMRCAPDEHPEPPPS